MVYGIKDVYGEIITTPRAIDIETVLEKSSNLTFATTLLGSTTVSGFSGVAILKDLVIVGTPNSTQMLKVSSRMIDLNIPSNVRASADSHLVVGLRLCEKGEELIATGACLKCLPLTFSFTENAPCEPCLKNAACPGGTELFPLPGYWRKSNVSMHIYPCFLQESCLGGLNPA